MVDKRNFWFCGPVFYQEGDYDRDEMVAELKRIRACGFDLVRFHHCLPAYDPQSGWDFSRTDDFFQTAEEAGIRVSMCAEGLEKVHPSILVANGTTPERFSVSHLEERCEQDALTEYLSPVIAKISEYPALFMWQTLGEPHPFPESINNEYDIHGFSEWVKCQYGTLEQLDKVWNIYPAKGKPICPSLEEAWKIAEVPALQSVINGVTNAGICYGAQRDRMKYLSEKGVSRAGSIIRAIRAADPAHPVSLGAHQLFINQPSLNWDTYAWARQAEFTTTSIHLSWHFILTEGEFEIPLYLQSRMTRDVNKHGLASAYETTSGPVQYSGGYGNHMSRGLMRKLMLTYMATGVNGIAFWTWNTRPGGWEMGEYGMVSASGAVEPWAFEAGAVSQKIRENLPELCHEEDRSGKIAVLDSWDTDAIYTMEPDRHELLNAKSHFFSGSKVQGKKAVVGAGRAFVNQHQAFEYIGEEELCNGFANQYRTVFLPHRRAISMQALEALEQYVVEGGRLVVDVQFAFCDPWGKLYGKGRNTLFGRLLGSTVESIHDTRTTDVEVGGNKIHGLYGEVSVDSADVLYRFSDGSSAVTVQKYGKGTAVLIGFDIAMMCFEKGNSFAEKMLSNLCGAGLPSYETDAPICYVREYKGTRHFFFINDGSARTCFLKLDDQNCYQCEDVLDGHAHPDGHLFAFELAHDNAKWLQISKVQDVMQASGADA